MQFIVIILAIAGNLIISWYGFFSGKLPAQGTYLGISYNSIFLRSLITQFEYLWVLVIINLIFTGMFHLGFQNFKSFLPLAIIWMASGPIAALLFNSVYLKEKIDIFSIVGIVLVIIGGIIVVAHKEVGALFT